jgi:multicomponent Na+:H+ antiporter subunit E
LRTDHLSQGLLMPPVLPTGAGTPFPIANFLKRFALLFGFWLVIAGNVAGAWVVGIAAAAIAAAISMRLLPPQARTVQLGAVLRLTPGFAWSSLLGGLDVAKRAFDPRLPVKPQWIAYAVRLPPGAARVSLGNELSLIPGTLAAGGDGDTLYVHCLDSDQPVDAHIAAEEIRLAESLGLSLESPDG